MKYNRSNSIPMEAPIPENEATRLKALRQLQILDSPPEAGFDDLTRLAALLCGTPTALVSLVDANRSGSSQRWV
jgi:hypothetical protein